MKAKGEVTKEDEKERGEDGGQGKEMKEDEEQIGKDEVQRRSKGR